MPDKDALEPLHDEHRRAQASCEHARMMAREHGKAIISPRSSTTYTCFGMFIGGAWGGTVGGIKIYRAIFILKGMLWNIRKSFYSQNTFRIMRFDEKVMLPEQINSELATASVFAILFFIILLLKN